MMYYSIDSSKGIGVISLGHDHIKYDVVSRIGNEFQFERGCKAPLKFNAFGEPYAEFDFGNLDLSDLFED